MMAKLWNSMVALSLLLPFYQAHTRIARSEAAAPLPELIEFPGPGGTQLSGVLYLPAGFGDVELLLRGDEVRRNAGEKLERRTNAASGAAVVMLHACNGMWFDKTVNSTNEDGTPNLVNGVEKWGLKLASEGIVAFAVDSFSKRVPSNLAADDKDWQNQCLETKYQGFVDPDTTRVQDARAAWDFLVGLGQIDASRIALMGWSQGAESAMVEAAATPASVDKLRPESDHRFAVTVTFYPRCNSQLGFGNLERNISFWRPRREFRLNMGDADEGFLDCQIRKNIAVNSYGSAVIFAGFHDTKHAFDTISQRWPSGKCKEAIGDVCAMDEADIDSLAFLKSHLLPH